MAELVPGYQLDRSAGHSRDRALLLKFMQQTYLELSPDGKFDQLEAAIGRFFSDESPLWWVRPIDQADVIGCLWIGNAIDQGSGDRQAHIFLLYVQPEYRRQGIGSALVRYAETWAKARGDRQIGLQVFEANLSALKLYDRLGYKTQSRWMTKSIQ